MFDNVVCKDIRIKRGRRIKSNHIPVTGSFLVPDGEKTNSISCSTHKIIAGYKFVDEDSKSVCPRVCSTLFNLMAVLKIDSRCLV